MRWLSSALLTMLIVLGHHFSIGIANAQEGDVVGVHDPCIISCDGKWYLFSTGAGVTVRTSKDLKQWEQVGQALPDFPLWAKDAVPKAEFPWAPDVAFFDGNYHLYYSVSTFGSNRSCIGHATTPTLDQISPKFKWIDQGLVVESHPGKDNFNAIDPNVVLDERGNPWLSFGSFWNGLYIAQLDKSGKAPVGRIRHIAGRSGGAIEAPFIVRRGKWYYLFVSFDNCCKGAESTYKVMVGRSKHVDGPYLDFSNKDMVNGGGTLLLASYKNFRGPGHNAVLTGKDASYLVHHFYDESNGGLPTLQIRPMLWASDDWPVVGEPGIPEALTKPLVKANMSGKYEHSVDYGKGDSISLLASGKINKDDGRATWLLQNGQLQLRWPRNDAPRGAWVDECFVSPNGNWYVGRNEQGMIIRGVRID